MRVGKPSRARLLAIYRRCLAQYEAAGDLERAAIERRLIDRIAKRGD